MEEIFSNQLNVHIKFEKPCQIIQSFRNQLPDYLIQQEIIVDLTEWQEFERAFTLEMAKRALIEKAGLRDQEIIQAIRTIDDIDKTLNLFSGRMREWFGLHFPELDNTLESHEKYARFIIEIGERSKINKKNLKTLIFENNLCNIIIKKAKTSVGAPISKDDLAILREFTQKIIELNATRDKLEEYIKLTTKEVAPNMSHLVGATISARLISLAGSLENLAKMPASTIQVLGAEKALFRAIKTGSPPPKHGIIFQHAAVHQSPRWQRGKIARTLASKLTIASRLDSFSGDYRGDQLKKELEDRITEIKIKYAEPPRKRRRRHGDKAFKKN